VNMRAADDFGKDLKGFLKTMEREGGAKAQQN